ncbi:MAG TPA: type II toxin-antitoxin system PemK/MazF family toxin [Firmicutes bacterium]|nr:type II toxin-antitoxin system PemK/MazF family toxin [Bacillota bacterium]
MANSPAVVPGSVLLVTLPTHAPRGHEQEGKRPVVLVGAPSGTLRYPVVIVVPLTTQGGPWVQENPAIYPCLAAGDGGLPCSSVALLDQIRGIDVKRVKEYLGVLGPDGLSKIRAGLKELLSI